MPKTKITNEEARAIANGMYHKAYGQRIKELEKLRNDAGDELFQEAYGIPSNFRLDILSRYYSAEINGVQVYCSCSVPCVLPKVGEYKSFAKYAALNKELHKLKEQANHFRTEVICAMENLRTIKKIREQMPEVLNFIVLEEGVKPENALALRYDSLREKYNKLIKK